MALGGAALAATALPEPSHDIAPPLSEAPAPAWAAVDAEPAAAPVETVFEFSAPPVPVDPVPVHSAPVETAPFETAPVEPAPAAPVATYTDTWSVTPAESVAPDPEPAVEPVAPPPAQTWAAAPAANPWVQVETVPSEADESDKDKQPG